MSAAWIVEDFNSDMHRLNSLLGVICEMQFGLDRGASDPRVDDLLWIAREITEGLTGYDDQRGRAVRMTGGQRNG